MKSIVPIIGQEFLKNRPDLKSWAEFLLHERGYDVNWIDDRSIRNLQTSHQRETYVPLIFNLNDSENSNENLYFAFPLADHFRTSVVISVTLHSLAKIIFTLPPEFSLWEIPAPQDVIRRSISYIYLNISEALSAQSIAHAVSISKSSLESKFEQVYNLGIMQFARRIRLRQSKRILLETIDSIAEIASAVGYPDFRSFERVFGKEYDMNPTEYRKKHNWSK